MVWIVPNVLCTRRGNLIILWQFSRFFKRRGGVWDLILGGGGFKDLQWVRTLHAIHVHLNCKYHPWGLINDMQMSKYNRKHWHALPHSLHFVRHPRSPASMLGSRLPIFNSVCLGLVPGQIDSPYLIIMSWITIPRDEYYTMQSNGFDAGKGHQGYFAERQMAGKWLSSLVI